MSIMTATRGSMCYCPGCSHAQVLVRLGQAIDRLNLTPQQVCLVTDIGCIGTADQYFTCNTFHGLHGRSITYAEGIKRYNPDMLVIVLIGDGGCGIGSAHLVHAARRGVGIKIIVCNNFNFGMTGGQHSPTTLPGGLTSTTPGGMIERPMDICGTVMVNGAAYVARHNALDPEGADQIEALLRSDGFGLIDLWELCTAHYAEKNRIKAAQLSLTAEQLGMPFGVLKRSEPSPPTDASSEIRSDSGVSGSVKTHREESTGSPLRLDRRIEICLAGSAGQRIVSAIGTIGQIAVQGGVYAAELDDFPITVRRGFSVSNLILDQVPIDYTGVDEPHVLVLMSEDGLRRVSAVSRLPKGSVVWAEESLQLPSTEAEVIRFNLAQVSKAVGNASAALAILTQAIVRMGCIAPNELKEAAHQTNLGKYRDDQLKALEYGMSPIEPLRAP